MQAKRRMEEVKVRLSDPNAARRAFRAVKKTVNAVGQELVLGSCSWPFVHSSFAGACPQSQVTVDY